MAERLAVFDLDGTLADTAPDLVGALNAVLISEGLSPAPLEAARSTAGLGGRALMKLGFELAGRPQSSEDIEARVPHFLEAYEARIAEQSRFFEGVEEALDALSEAGWGLSVCTNKPERLALLLLRELGAVERFASILGADSLPVKKPDPTHLLETIARAGGDPRRAVMIGDTETDHLAARNASVPVVLVQFGYWRAPVSELAPDAEIAAYHELPPLLERMLPR